MNYTQQQVQLLRKSTMPSHDLSEFLKLSAVLNYQLSAKQINWNGIESIILGQNKLTSKNKDVLFNTIQHLHHIYGTRKRRLGSLAVLHPLRVATFLSRASTNPSIVEYLTTLLHDVYEDIKPDDIDHVNWIHPDESTQAILNELPEIEQWYLMERLGWLTKRNNETYYEYIGRFLNSASKTPEVVRAKLADRLDNTLDLRIELEDPLEGLDFFEIVFQILYNKSFKGKMAKVPHSSITAINGSERLYQLFKNIVLMSLVRQTNTVKDDPISTKLLNGLAKASMKEAQRITLHIFAYHEKSVPKCRELLIETMKYVTSGGVESVTAPTQGYRLDGFMVSQFSDPTKKQLKEKLRALYDDKPLMFQASIAFIVIFLSFLTNQNFFVQGISPAGVKPATKGK
jgi:hypothetical protein